MGGCSVLVLRIVFIVLTVMSMINTMAALYMPDWMSFNCFFNTCHVGLFRSCINSVCGEASAPSAKVTAVIVILSLLFQIGALIYAICTYCIVKIATMFTPAGVLTGVGAFLNIVALVYWMTQAPSDYEMKEGNLLNSKTYSLHGMILSSILLIVGSIIAMFVQHMIKTGRMK
ncbi:unnamed protein product [Bursaphelenchus okinawaensis]|uniref:Uncharacterized protein n=1 Tax=Bursaphelenchus okinawaensis TaxID=465554 RepID=A0A811JRI1_9BILA|nr:unnamed protein product [Bursaphelenchus okinawaensis]CAG9079879.1 unnamed protein product [Bursaphelenchus okinawaensis]